METSRSVSCGAWGCRPPWLQRFATPRTFLWVYGLLGTTQTMAYLYFVATLTTMERRFKIPSKTTGLMMSGNEISQIFLSLLLTYFGGRGNRPRWIAWGVAISAVSCFILAMPHFLYGAGTAAHELTKEFLDQRAAAEREALLQNLTLKQSSSTGHYALCNATEEVVRHGSQACDAQSEGTMEGDFSLVPVLLVFLSQFVLGIGSTLYYALGQIYLDDNSRKANTPKLLGMTLALRTLGPALGFALGFACLSLYVDPWLTPVIDKRDPRWIGAWWLGWLLLGAAMLLFAGLIALFPRHLPPKPLKEGPTKQPEDTKAVAETLLPRHHTAPQLEKPTLKEFPAALKRLLHNKLLMTNILSSVFYILGSSGYITFSIKYMEVQYHASAAGASMLAGTGGLLAMVLGFLLSGYFISKYQPAPKYLLFWNVIAGSMYIFSEIIFIFIGCDNHHIYGAPDTGGPLNFLSACNSGCECPPTLPFSPVCIGNTTFFSPCHAGCSEHLTSTSLEAKNLTFASCECASEVLGTFSSSPLEARDGACMPECGLMVVYFLIITCAMHMVGSSSKIGNILVNFRCVEPQDKAFAQGLALMFISLFAFIPGPIIYGAIIDSTCIIWNESCGRRGNCSLYDKRKFRLYMNVGAASITTIAVLLDLLVWHMGKNLDLYGDPDHPQQNKNQKRIKNNN